MENFTHIVVFGDSGADIGKVHKISGGKSPLPGNYKGRYSNGPLWCDILAKKHKLKHINYAHGNATINNEIVSGLVPYSPKKSQTSDVSSSLNELDTTKEQELVEVPCVKQQILKYTKFYNKNNSYRDLTLYVIFAGTNDVTAPVHSKMYNIKEPFDLKRIANETSKCVRLLLDKCDAKYIVVFNLRPREDFPGFIKMYNDKQRDDLREETLEYNKELKKALTSLSSESERQNVWVYDIYKRLKNMKKNASMYGLVEPVEICELDFRRMYKREEIKLDYYMAETKKDSENIRPGPPELDGITLRNEENRRFMWWDYFHLAKYSQEIVANDIGAIVDLGFGSKSRL
ncbi:hypothetical protein BB559_002057 [Furculomyces boomerangus]|uniref:SGNH hydrolase-type esterase domain-containing protein n=1 Tax=Furculomyces boomerangus TaxID=61424 RepID=A0A2T9YYJ8_9FUNG|nr:hypothetical protein BB559_002057 [Furculomyces boomerangus]